MGCAKPGRGICEKKHCFSVLNRGLTTYKFHGILVYSIISITSFAVALAWPLNNPAVTAPIIGPRTREQFTGIFRCSGTDLNLMKLASSSSPSLSSICKTSTKGYYMKMDSLFRSLCIRQMQAILRVVQLESNGHLVEVVALRRRPQPLPHLPRPLRHLHYRPICQVRFTEVRIELIQRQLESLLRRVEILDADNHAVPIHGFRLRRIQDWRGPTPLLMENIGSLSSKCNIKCIFCFISGNPLHIMQPLLSLHEVCTRLRHYDPRTRTGLFQTYDEYMEPFWNPNALPILQLVRQRAPNEVISVITNGTLLDESAVRELAKLKPISITVSLNSADPDQRAQLMRDRYPQRAINLIPMLRRFQVPFAGSIVAWPTVPLADIEKTARYLDAHDARNIRITLPGFTRYQPDIPECDFEEHWLQVVALVLRLRKQIGTFIMLQPHLYWQQHSDARIGGVMRNSPAWEAGLQVDDVIEAVNDTPTPYREDALRELANPAYDMGPNRRELQTRRNDQTFAVTLVDDSTRGDDRYPYKPVGYASSDLVDHKRRVGHFGLWFAEGFAYSWLARLAQVVLHLDSYAPLIVSSKLVKPVLLHAMEKAGPAFLHNRQVQIISGNNIYWGGNIVLGDLMMVDDYRQTIEAYLRQADIYPDLIVLPSSFMLGWKRDFTGKPYTRLHHHFDIPITLVPCNSIGI